MDALQILQTIDRSFTTALERGLGKHGLVLPIDQSRVEDPELAKICARIERTFEMINEAYRYAETLATGELNQQVGRSNVFAMPLKALQASLCHLTWQTNEVANGDLNQEVRFLGEFSQAFNHMINALRDKAVLEQRLRTINDVLGEGVYLVDARGNLVFINPEGENLLGYRLVELLGKPIHEYIHRQRPDGSHFSPDECPIYAAIQAGQSYDNDDAVYTCKSGLHMPVSLSCRPVVNNGVPDGAVVAFRNITSQKKYEQSLKTINDLLERQATTDALTGLCNRLKLSKVLRLEIERAHREQSELSVILLDVDDFKQVNDRHGHLQGDVILKNLARLLSSKVRREDTIARWGGEEFMIVTPGWNISEATDFAERLRHRVAQHRFSISQPITASFGAATFRPGDTENTLTNRADEALYSAKQRGRDRVEAG